MELRLDLHIHSERSPDGRMSLEEIGARARKAGLDGVAVCDHDRTPEELPDLEDVLLIPGVEVSTEYGHLLGLFVTKPVAGHELAGAVEEIHRQGGLAVLAHPFERSTDAERLSPILPLLDGVEVWNSRAERKNKKANAMARELARANGLRPFGGSDAHLPQEIGSAVTAVEAEAFTLEGVKAALLTGRANVTGRRSPARYVAASQYTKLRKKGGSPLGWCRWALFAMKCCAQDLVER